MVIATTTTTITIIIIIKCSLTLSQYKHLQNYVSGSLHNVTWWVKRGVIMDRQYCHWLLLEDFSSLLEHPNDFENMKDRE